jgi:tRNA1Val (adenine37-N6)-methyltransferase
MFQFKQFSVDQTGCAMKINTDGVLLGALAVSDNPATILDIGTGTGVIALMLAQRFASARIDAVEIDENAAKTAQNNFKNAPFCANLSAFPLSFEVFFANYPHKKYDLIVSNPPFHINSLESPKAKKSLAKHVGTSFFENLIEQVSTHLTENGLCWLILPLQAAELVKQLARQHKLYLQKVIAVRSFEYSESHREILVLGYQEISTEMVKFTIYQSKDNYSDEYKTLLKPYFIAF